MCRLLTGYVQAVYRLRKAVYRLYAGCLQAVRRLLQAGASCLQAEAGCVYAVYRLLQVVYRLCRFSAVRFVNVQNSFSVMTHLCLQSTSLASRSLSLSRTAHGYTQQRPGIKSTCHATIRQPSFLWNFHVCNMP